MICFSLFHKFQYEKINSLPILCTLLQKYTVTKEIVPGISVDINKQNYLVLTV